MADISKITALDGNTYNLKDASAISGMTASGTTITYTKRDGSSDSITIGESSISKTYAPFTASADSRSHGCVYFGIVDITDKTNFYAPWKVRYRLTVTTDVEQCNGVYDCEINISGTTSIYSNYNSFNSTSYKPIQYQECLRPNSGYTDQGGYIGTRVYGAYNPTTVARTFKVEIIETVGCTVTLMDTLKEHSEVYSSTKYTYVETNASSLGLQETGDNDSWNYLKAYTVKAKHNIPSESIIVGDDGGYFPLNEGGAFDITYTPLFAHDAISATRTGVNNYEFQHVALILSTQLMTLTQALNVYIKGNLSGVTFTPISSTPLTQSVPTSADGYDYMYIGRAVSDTEITFDGTSHQIFKYKNGAFRSVYEDTVYDDLSSKPSINNVELSGNKTSDDLGITTEIMDAISNAILDKLYPVGSIYLETTNTNPSEKLGGTWEAYGSSDTYLRLGGDGEGGNNTYSLTSANIPSHTHSFTPSGSVSEHSHGLNNHTHSFTPSGSVSKHSHGLNNHTHSFTPAGSVNSHAHGLNGHAHSLNGVASHSHNVAKDGNNLWPLYGTTGSYVSTVGSGWGIPNWSAKTSGANTAAATLPNVNTGGNSGNTAGNTAGFTGTAGTTGGNSGNTTETTPTFTGTAGTTGGNTGNTGNATPTFTGSSGTTGSYGSATVTAIDVQPKYVQVYAWKRTA